MSSEQETRQPAAPSSPGGHDRRARSWYRRRLLIIPLVLLVVFGAGGGALAWRLNSSIATLQELTTPEPEISGEELGGDTDLMIDTSPAREAVRAATEAANAPDSGTSGDGIETGGGDDRDAQEPDAPALAAQETGAPDDAMNVLLMGVDARPGEPIDAGVRPDALAVLHLDPATGTCRMLAVPRDTRVELTGYGQSKVNHALAIGGIPYQQLVMTNYLGIPIEHYGLIDFTGVVTAVDEVGGVTIDIPESFTANGVSFEPGTRTLDGDEALAYARYRGGPDGDFGRIERQQQILRALLDEVSGQDLVTLIPDMLPLLEEHTRTDLDLGDLLGLARDFRPSCTEDTLETSTLEGTVATLYDPILQLDLSYVVVDEAEVRRKVEWLTGDQGGE